MWTKGRQYKVRKSTKGHRMLSIQGLLRLALSRNRASMHDQIVLDRSLPKPGELERNVIRPSRSLTRARTRNLQNSQPQPPTAEQTKTRLPAVTSLLEPRIPKKNVLEGMVRESRVRPPHPLPCPNPNPGGDEGPSLPRRQQRSRRCLGDGL